MHPSTEAPSTPVGVRAWWRWLALAALALSAVAAWMAWSTQQAHHRIEQTLVQRQAESQALVGEARALANAADAASREAQAKATLLEARVAESTVQRSQVEAMMLQLSKTRDDHVVNELEALLRTATLQASWTGRSEPLVAALRQIDERLGAAPSPRLAPVRRAVARDLQRITSSASTDTTSLALRIDELLVRADELPLLVPLDGDPVAASAGVGTPTNPSSSNAANAGNAGVGAGGPVGAGSANKPVASSTRRGSVPLDTPARTAPDDLPPEATAWQRATHGLKFWWRDVVQDVRSLVRVRRVDQPTAQMLSPEQAYFVRENLKLRLLSARWALLSRQTTLALTDLGQAQAILSANHDKLSKRVEAAQDTLSQVATAVQQLVALNADETLGLLVTLGGVLVPPVAPASPNTSSPPLKR
jgi:uroporphyrin-III C-methyltransferase